MYNLPEFNFKDFKNKFSLIFKDTFSQVVFLVGIIIVAVVFYTGVIYLGFYAQDNQLFKEISDSFIPNPVVEQQKPATQYVSDISYEQAIIDVVKSASPSVVSIIISKNLPVYEEQFINPFENFPDFGFGPQFNFQIPQQVQKGTKKQEVGAGSGFIVSEDGLIVTNKHVVFDKQAEYTVFTNDGKKYDAKVLALDPVQDLAIVKIQSDSNLPSIKLGDSNGIQIGQGVIAIGNALGEFRNTVSVGIISGLGRTISASGSQGFSETLEDVIQTDAAINLGNSGGPLLNLKGEVIGVNTAMAEGAEAIGFAIPINIAKRDIDQIIKKSQPQNDQGSSTGSGQIKIVYPFLGVRYVLVDEKVKQKYNLSVDYGALILKGANGEPAITSGSAAAKAGLKEKDVILEVNGEKITEGNSMSKVIQKYNPEDNVILKILRGGEEINIDVVLGERN